MTKQAQILRVVIASPSDVQAERDVVSKVADELNHGIAADHGLRLEISRWETDAYPDFHQEGPQGLIDHILQIKDCDILIGIFWKRFGTPVKDAKSGSGHEFQLAYEAWKQKGRPHIMLYFNQKSYTPKTRAETDQWGQVLDFKQHVPSEGLWWAYKGVAEFDRLVRNHLTQFLREGHVPQSELREERKDKAQDEFPWAEYEELVGTLDRFATSYREVDGLLARFLSLSFASPAKQSLGEARMLLIEAEGGNPTQAFQLRSHCNDLRALYTRLSLAELKHVQDTFGYLDIFHADSLPLEEEIMRWLAETASKVLHALDADDLEGADQLIKQARIDVLPRRQAMSRAVSALLSLESSYLEAVRKRPKPKRRGAQKR